MSTNEDIKDIRNDIDRIRTDIDGINRIQVLANSTVILTDLRKKVGKSKLMVAALFLARNWISSGDLAKDLRINHANLNKVVNPLFEGGLLYREKRAQKVYYKRATRLDLIQIESISDLKSVFESWQQNKGEQED
jgi:predicted transcriptional regulator